MVMAADPHAPGTHEVQAEQHALHGSIAPKVPIDYTSAESPGCAAFDAVRTDRLSRDPHLSFANPSALPQANPDTRLLSPAPFGAPGVSPSQLRARLQVWRI